LKLEVDSTDSSNLTRPRPRGQIFRLKEGFTVKKTINPAQLITAGLLLIVVAVLPITAQAMDADELIAKSIEASGGLEKIKSVDSVKFTGKFLAPGMEFPFSMIQKRPGMMRINWGRFAKQLGSYQSSKR
jgi:hypothetical protein